MPDFHEILKKLSNRKKHNTGKHVKIVRFNQIHLFFI